MSVDIEHKQDILHSPFIPLRQSILSSHLLSPTLFYPPLSSSTSQSATRVPAFAWPSSPTPHGAAPLSGLIFTKPPSAFCVLRAAQNMRRRTAKLHEPLRHSSCGELVALGQLR